ncbi:primosomal protein N' [Actinoplanes sp. NPDC049548]|uniref:primosomal protein N' n=1 Tax=Actinoplanes sp. NPDC049548 TaxID=3155152 RepID=UPI00344AF3AE
MTAKSRDREPAATLPVARVCVDVPLPHLDRPFDYLVPAADDEAAQPGVRVKVRFAGQMVNGFLLERVESSSHAKLAYLDKVVSAETVLDPEIARLARSVADRYAGNLSDVLRLAVPPRHARVEAQSTPPPITSGETFPAAVGGAGPVAVDVSGGVGPVAVDAGGGAGSVAVDAGGGAGPVPVDAGGGVRPAAVDAGGGIGPVAVGGSGGARFAVVGGGGAVPAAGGEDVPARIADGDPADRSGPVGAEVKNVATAAGDVPIGDPADSRHGLEDSASSLGMGGDGPGVPSSVDGDDGRPARGAMEHSAVTGPHGGPAGNRSDSGVPGHGPGDEVPGRGPGGEVAVGELRGTGWDDYPAGSAFLHALAQGRAPRAVWSALPGENWPARIAEAAAATVRSGRGVVVVVADARDLERVDHALGKALGAGRHVALNAAAGPSERYRRFLAASRHQVPVVVGTRAAMFAPVGNLGLVVIWDDGDDLHAEPRAPYPHAREVLLTRAHLAGCGALVGGFARTGEAQLLLETGWAKEIVASRDTLRARSPLIAPTGDDSQLARDPGAVSARLPSLAWQTARQALQAGMPVLVQVPRRGYLPSVACAECRTPARCPHCSGPLGLAGARSVPSCHWCGRTAAAYACPACGGRRLRASVTGARRTAEELGRAFPGVPVRTSGRDEVLDTVPGDAAVVVATPGAEPVAEGGYGAVLLLDTWALLTRADLRAAEETMRRWLSAASLARPGSAGGRVVVVADGSLAPVQALLRWDPGWFAARELTERRELGFPPAARFASLTGKAEAVAELLAATRLPEGAELLGPVPAPEDQERMLVRVSRGRAAELARALHEGAAVRSAKKALSPVRVQVDPAELL